MLPQLSLNKIGRVFWGARVCLVVGGIFFFLLLQFGDGAC